MGQEQASEIRLFEVDLGENGGVFAPKSAEEIVDWLDREREFWAWLEEKSVKDQSSAEPGSFLPFANAQGKSIRHLRQLVERLLATDAPEEPTFRNAIDEMRKVFIDRFQFRPNQERKSIHSSNLDAQRISTIREKQGPIEAIAALNVVCSEPTRQLNNYIQFGSSKQFGGVIALWLMRAGVSPETPEAVRNSLQQLHADYQGRHDQAVKEIEALQGDLSALVAEHEETSTRGLRALAISVRQVRHKASKQREEANGELEKLKKFYNDSLSLQEPVDYWEKVAKEHGEASTTLSWCFGGSLIVVGFAVGIVLALTPLGSKEFLESNPFAAAGFGLTLVGFLVWIPRLLVRSIFSNLHLRNDARHRRTMALTYLALREGGHADKEQMSLVLAQLFAPASDGLVKEEIGPLAAAETLKAMSSPKSLQ